MKTTHNLSDANELNAQQDVNQNERIMADLWAKLERRNIRNLEKEARSFERLKIEDDLAKERRLNNIEINKAVKFLADEQAAHQVTKDELISREELMAIVSHDLRNPIGAISNCTEMLRESSSTKIDEEMEKWLAFIDRNANSALRLVNDLLDLERISTGKFDLQLASHDIVNLIKQSIQNAASYTMSKMSIQFTPPDEPIFVVCDADRVIQVVGNLIGNAEKFNPAEGRITIDIRELSNRFIEVSVSDTGTGIPVDELNRIFERFSQLGKKDRRGLGLGLYISKVIVEAQGGQLSVKSTIGEGSTFSFTLPV